MTSALRGEKSLAGCAAQIARRPRAGGRGERESASVRRRCPRRSPLPAAPQPHCRGTSVSVPASSFTSIGQAGWQSEERAIRRAVGIVRSKQASPCSDHLRVQSGDGRPVASAAGVRVDVVRVVLGDGGEDQRVWVAEKRREREAEAVFGW